MKFRWKELERSPEWFSEAMRPRSRVLADLIWNRGVRTPEEAAFFLEPSYDNSIHSPFLLRGMKEAVERITRAIDSGDPIRIFGDYDADGVDGAVVLSDFFTAVNAISDVVIPDRIREPYGLSITRVEEAFRDGIKLLITVDCGVSNFNEIQLARSHGIDVIVVDHHIVPPVWPDAIVINYKHPDDQYPEKVLCGTGLAFKLVQGLIASRDWGLHEGWEKWLLDCVAIGTIADMVPLTGENRTLVKYGLLVLSKTRRPGLRKVLQLAGAKIITGETVGFTVAPLINAASRMEHADLAFRLLTTRDPDDAEKLALTLRDKNVERREVVSQILEEVHAGIQEPVGPFIFTGGSWPPGVLGLVASRLTEKYSRPSFVYSIGAEFVKGSVRSPEGSINVVEWMQKGKEYFTDFGGHSSAGGFSLKEENLSFLKVRLEEALPHFEPGEVPELEIDARIDPSDINQSLFSELLALEPTGRGNRPPRVLVSDLVITEVREVGEARNHLKVMFYPKVSAIGFGLGERHGLAVGDAVDVVAEIIQSYWRGASRIELRVIDFHKRNS